MKNSAYLIKKISFLSAILMLCVPQLVQAHFIDVGWKDNFDQTLSFYATSNHSPAAGAGGISINGIQFGFDTVAIAQTDLGWNTFATTLDGSVELFANVSTAKSQRSVTLNEIELATAGLVGGLNPISLGGFGSSGSIWDTPGATLQQVQISFSVVPEPSSIILLSLGIAGLSFARYRKQF